MRYGSLALALLVFSSLFGTSDAIADRTYVVRSGDTLSGIARRFHTSIRTIQRANRIRGESIREGQRLRIPGARARARAARRNGYHIVRRGQTLSHIARRYRVSIRALKRANRIRGEHIREGQRLRIPGRRRENHLPRVATRELRPDQEEAQGRAETLGLGSVRVAHTLLGGPGPEERWVEASRQAPRQIPEHAYGEGTPIVPSEEPEEDEEPEDTPDDLALDHEHEDYEETPPETSAANDTPEPSAGPGTLRSPLDEAIYLRGWGSGPGGYHLAVDLYAPPGTPVKASERGIVAYEGHGLRGYGRMVVLLHPSGRVSAYAHNRETLVVEGELVARGQVIALVGNTGISRGPHVHFMLVDSGEHCDALPLFRPRIRWRNGNIVETDPTAWTGDRPEEVRCLPKSARPHPGTRRRRRRGRRRRR